MLDLAGYLPHKWKRLVLNLKEYKSNFQPIFRQIRRPRVILALGMVGAATLLFKSLIPVSGNDEMVLTAGTCVAGVVLRSFVTSDEGKNSRSRPL